MTAKTSPVSTSNAPYTLSIEADGVTSPMERVVRCHRVRRQSPFARGYPSARESHEPAPPFVSPSIGKSLWLDVCDVGALWNEPPTPHVPPALTVPARSFVPAAETGRLPFSGWLLRARDVPGSICARSRPGPNRRCFCLHLTCWGPPLALQLLPLSVCLPGPSA